LYTCPATRERNVQARAAVQQSGDIPPQAHGGLRHLRRRGKDRQVPAECPAHGDHQLYLVADHDGVFHQVPVVGILQHGALDELAVAVAVARVRVAARAGNLHSTLFQLAAFGKVAPAALLLVHDREMVEGSHHLALA
jgi:hypothetical protein